MITPDDLAQKLKLLREQLASDLMLSVNRDQHIRATQRVQTVDQLIEELTKV